MDPRLHPLRADLAGEELRDKMSAVDAPAHYAPQHFVKARTFHLCVARSPLRVAPALQAPWGSELRFHDLLNLYDIRDGFAWVQNQRDHYMGYVDCTHIAEGAQPTPTHYIKNLMAPCRGEPNVKSPPLHLLSFLSKLQVLGDAENGFYPISINSTQKAFIAAAHVALLSETVKDYVFTAGRFLGVPYVWGGTTAFGLDCSGLVQLALSAAGISCPRDTDMQQENLGQPIALGEAHHRGDFIFFKGHVALATAEDHVIHANAHHGMVAAEPLRDMLSRLGSPSAIRRL